MSKKEATGDTGSPGFECQCTVCGGNGLYLDTPCPDCRGSGVVVTEYGYDLLAFIMRRLELNKRSI